MDLEYNFTLSIICQVTVKLTTKFPFRDHTKFKSCRDNGRKVEENFCKKFCDVRNTRGRPARKWEALNIRSYLMEQFHWNCKENQDHEETATSIFSKNIQDIMHTSTAGYELRIYGKVRESWEKVAPGKLANTNSKWREMSEISESYCFLWNICVIQSNGQIWPLTSDMVGRLMVKQERWGGPFIFSEEH